MLELLAKPVTQKKNEILAKKCREFISRAHRPPQLTVVLVGEDPASVIYTRKKGEMAVSLGFEHKTLCFPATAAPEEVKSKIQSLNEDPLVDGILIQRPLPKSFREDEVLFWVDPSKDVDAFHPIHMGRLSLGLPCFVPCTPAGIMELLKHYQIPIAGKTACIVGRSSIVGRPMAALMLAANATVIHCHSHTPDLRAMTRQADLLIVAAGKRGLIDGSFIKKDAVVVDVGIHRTPESKLAGDVLYPEAAKIASAMTPVPGGVGPMTIALLMENTLSAAFGQLDHS